MAAQTERDYEDQQWNPIGNPRPALADREESGRDDRGDADHRQVQGTLGHHDRCREGQMGDECIRAECGEPTEGGQRTPAREPEADRHRRNHDRQRQRETRRTRRGHQRHDVAKIVDAEPTREDDQTDVECGDRDRRQ